MNHEVLKQVIFDQRQVIRDAVIVDRAYDFEPEANYVVVGMRRSGKSTLLYKRAREIVDAGADWNQIVYVNFEDERLVEFGLEDFNDIVQTAAELSDARPFFFFDEIQNVSGWERFARRLADAHERVSITGSNATMLSAEMESRLGGRYLSKEVTPYSFSEFLDAKGVAHDQEALCTATLNGTIRSAAVEFLREGGLPESVGWLDRRSYAESVYQKVLLGDIAARHAVRKVQTLRVLMKKIAETVTSPVSYSRLRKAVSSTGISCSTDSAISYVGFAEESYLVFSARNYVAKFSEREGVFKYYFNDNGLLNLFLVNRDSRLLENAVATDLRRRHGPDLYYLRSERTGIDLDFYVPEESVAVQVCWTLDEGDFRRETASLAKLARDGELGLDRSVIVTFEDDEKTLIVDGVEIEVVPLYRFLLR